MRSERTDTVRFAPPPPLRAGERACLVIGDLTGYSSYLGGTELEHAQDVLADLLETVVAALEPTLRLSKVEGDAVFAYAPAEELEPTMLLDTIDAGYFAFRRRRRDVRQATTCDCNACRRIPDLDLKFVAHHGTVARQQVAGHEELAGSDVILVHRLLKNTAGERFGLDGYALLTDACVDALQLDPQELGLREHVESYPDVGEVAAWVADLEARWRDEEERRRVYVEPAAADFQLSTEVAGPPPLVWEVLTSPEKRAVWSAEVTRIDEWHAGGRRGAGTTVHCVHGRTTVVEEILDWRPFHYVTLRRRLPVLGPWASTIEFLPLGEDATELRVRGERFRGPHRRFLWRLARPGIIRTIHEDLERLREAVAFYSEGRRAA